MNLYLIALIPHLELREQIRSLKEEMKVRFYTKHALKSPAHITLQMPFKRSKEDEHHLISILQEFASGQYSFKVELSNFSCFSPRVIFVKVENHEPIIELQSKMKKALSDGLSFKENEVSKNIHPHMTIATRDLTEKAFLKAWSAFEKHEFKATFKAKSLFLLKHNGKSWDIYKEFLFQE